MPHSSAAQFAFVLSFSVSLALVLALVVSWPRLIRWLGRNWWRPFCLALSLTLPLLLLLLLFTLGAPIPSIFPYFFGFLAALGTSQLLVFSRRSQATIAASLPWLIIFLFSVIAGIYPDVSASLFSALREARIEATGIHFILAEERSRDAKLPVFEFDARPLVTARTWPYKSGMQSLQNLTDDILDETDRLSHYCTLKVFQQFCDGDGRSSGAMHHFLSATRAYFTAIRPLVQCLAAYGHRFPNGLPIQDELSEIAMSFARPDNADDVKPSQLDNVQALMSNIVAEVAATAVDGQATPPGQATLSFEGICSTQLQDGLDQYYGESSKTENGWIPPDYAKMSSADCEKVFSTQDQKLGCRVWKLIKIAREHWQSTWINGAKPPYRALFETYLITAAGYPQDAAYYIQREFNIYKEGGLQNYGRLANWLFLLRTLHATERLLEEAGDFSKQSNALKDLSDVYDEFFRELVGTDQIDPLLKECRARWENTDLWKGISEDDGRADVRGFLSKTLFLHMKEELRRWQTQNKNQVPTAELREIGDEFAGVFADREGFFGGCFRGWIDSLPEREKQIEEQIGVMYAEFGLTSGAMKLAELVSSIERNEEYGQLSEERSTLLCEARNIFENVGDELPPAGERGPWHESAWERLSKFNEAINAWRVQC